MSSMSTDRLKKLRSEKRKLLRDLNEAEGLLMEAEWRFEHIEDQLKDVKTKINKLKKKK